MGILRGYLRFQILVVVAVAMAVGALTVLSSVGSSLTGFVLLCGLVLASFAVLAVLLALR